MDVVEHPFKPRKKRLWLGIITDDGAKWNWAVDESWQHVEDTAAAAAAADDDDGAADDYDNNEDERWRSWRSWLSASAKQQLDKLNCDNTEQQVNA